MADLPTFSAELSGFVARAGESLVSIVSRRARASGFVWKPGLVVTNDEALPEEGELSVELAGGARTPAVIAGRDPSTAIALIRIESGDAPALPLSDKSISAGALALGVGALDGAPLAALALVARASGAWRSLRGGDIDRRIELDVRLRKAAYGGVALDARGEAFGMLVEGPRRRTLVIPTATIERVATTLRDKGRIARGYLGLGLQPVLVAHAGKGSIVMSVDENGPGAKAGLLQGDVIVTVDGAPAGELRALLRNLGPDSIGRSLRLSLRRGGAPLDVDLAISERPT